jgi:hypothetical protein
VNFTYAGKGDGQTVRVARNDFSALLLL